MTDLCVTREYVDEVDSRLSLLITVKMEDHPSLMNNTKDWVTVGLYYDNRKIFVIQEALWTLRGQVADVVPVNIKFHCLFILSINKVVPELLTYAKLLFNYNLKIMKIKIY